MTAILKPPTPEEAAQELMRRRAARGSLYEFVKQSWHVIEGGRVLRTGWALEAVCLTGETLIETEIGPLPIGEIVGRRMIGLNVLSANHTTGNTEWRPILATMKNPSQPVYDLKTVRGSILHITGNHPVFVKERGYACAEGLRKKDVLVQMVREGILPQSSGASRRILQSGMLRRSEAEERELHLSGMRCQESVERRTLQEVLGQIESSWAELSVSKLWERCLQITGRLEAGEALAWSFLQQDMLRELYCGRASSVPYSREITRNLHEAISQEQKDSARAGWKCLLAMLVDGTARWSSHRLEHAQQRDMESRDIMPWLPQQTTGNEATDCRCVESAVCSVDLSVRIPREVFNIEVDGNNNYFANDILVHNCEHVQAVIEGHIRDFILNIPPRMTKSTVGSVCLTPWAWIDHPELQFMYLSYSDKLSGRDHRKARVLIESEWYQKRWGTSFNLAADQNTKVRYDNNHGGYRVTTSLTGTVTGDGGDVIVMDDPNSMSDLSDAGLEAVQSFWEDVMPTRLNDARTGRRIIIQQRGHEKDLTGLVTAAKDHGFTMLVLPMEFEVARRSITIPLPSTNGKKWRDPRKEEGELLWPERIGPDELAKIKRDLRTEYNISGQLQQRPAPGEGGIIKRKWFRLWTQEATPKLDYIIQSWDTALSEKKEAAFNACTTWGVFKDQHELPNMILLAAWRKRCEYNELREHAKRLSKNYLDDGDLDKPPKPAKRALKPDMILVEDKTTGKILIRDLQRAGVTVSGFNPDRYGDKTQRVRFTTPTLESGHIWVPGLPPDFTRPRHFADVALSQFASFPKGASRDLVDTMTQAIIRAQESGWVWRSDDANVPPPDEVRDIPEAIYG